MSKRLRDALHEVDPDLNIISTHHHKPDHSVTIGDWDAAAGPRCPICDKESFQLLPDPVNELPVCKHCNGKVKVKIDKLTNLLSNPNLGKKARQRLLALQRKAN